MIETLELEGEMPSCAADYLAVYDGVNSTTPLLVKLCGAFLTATPVASSSNVLFVEYFTDEEAQYGGFSAFFVSALPPTTTPSPQLTSMSSSRITAEHDTKIR